MKHFSLVLSFAVASALAAPAAFAGGGTIVKIQGNPDLIRKGRHVTATEAAPIYSGDMLNVPEGAVAQLHFDDDSVFVVPGAAKFRIDEFKMPVAGTGGRAIYTLLDGGIRTIAGSIEGAKGQYELRTPEGTVTVNGSAYTVLRCTGACAKKHPEGLYVKADSGIINVKSSGGSISLKSRQIAYTPVGGGTPIGVRASPFGDPELAGSFENIADFSVDIHPPRIEPELSASP